MHQQVQWPSCPGVGSVTWARTHLQVLHRGQGPLTSYNEYCGCLATGEWVWLNLKEVKHNTSILTVSGWRYCLWGHIHNYSMCFSVGWAGTRYSVCACLHVDCVHRATDTTPWSKPPLYSMEEYIRYNSCGYSRHYHIILVASTTTRRQLFAA